MYAQPHVFLNRFISVYRQLREWVRDPV